MMIIPAIDIKNGKCVRLLQGRMDAETVFSNDPSAMAIQWENQGAGMLHVVDLNGAFEKSPQNLLSIQQIVQAIHIPVQLGGGIRDLKTIQLCFDIGIEKVVIGTE
ncbi:MAG: HisA/HisF-related TIM barrel protein, partial [Desulfatirhabdiaceae bacterium]|nr:HisA/HisF-related TIM barrel protein [Desulfatirhabdiaceae bacterium]